MRIHNMLEVRLLYKKLEDYNKLLEQKVLEMLGIKVGAVNADVR